MSQSTFQKETELEIENLSFLALKYRADLALTMLGILPAARLEVVFDKRTGRNPEEFKSDLKKLEEFLKKYFIEYLIIPNDTEWLYVFIANTKENLDSLVMAYQMPNGKERDIQIGLALGYPRTAVANYGSSINQDLVSLPKEIKNSQEVKMLDFKLSKDHWKDEFEVVKKRSTALKKNTPILYKQIIAS